MNHKYHLEKVVLSIVLAICFITTNLSCSYLNKKVDMTYKKEEKGDKFIEKWSMKAKDAKAVSPSAKRKYKEEDIAVNNNDLPENKPAPQSKQLMQNAKREGYSNFQKGRSTDDAVKQGDYSEMMSTLDKKDRERPLPSSRVSMKMNDTDITTLLRALARAADVNIIINENVKGKANINIENAPWSQVFNGILKTHGLTYKWEGDIIRIIAVQDFDQELKLFEAKQQIEFKKAEFEEKIKSKYREAEFIEPLSTKIVTIDYADADNLKQNLEKFLTKGNGSISISKLTNSLIIQATKTDMKRILPMISELDRPTLQVLIEAHIVEANRETSQQLGFQWGGMYKGYGGSARHWIIPGAGSTGIYSGSGTTTDGATFYDSTGVLNNGINPSSGMAISALPGGAMASASASIGYIYESIGKSLLITQLSALQREGKVNILSSPSITTLDHQKSVIESGKLVPFQTVDDNKVKIEYKRACISLEVTPHVIDSSTLKLEILTNKDEISTSESVQGYPVIITKRAETKVLLQDGQTTVIGGLNKEKGDNAAQGVPYLKDIPVLGRLFNGTSNGKQMEELLIFITPHILKEEAIGKEAGDVNIPKKNTSPDNTQGTFPQTTSPLTLPGMSLPGGN